MALLAVVAEFAEVLVAVGEHVDPGAVPGAGLELALVHVSVRVLARAELGELVAQEAAHENAAAVFDQHARPVHHVVHEEPPERQPVLEQVLPHPLALVPRDVPHVARAVPHVHVDFVLQLAQLGLDFGLELARDFVHALLELVEALQVVALVGGQSVNGFDRVQALRVARKLHALRLHLLPALLPLK